MYAPCFGVYDLSSMYIGSFGVHSLVFILWVLVFVLPIGSDIFGRGIDEIFIKFGGTVVK